MTRKVLSKLDVILGILCLLVIILGSGIMAYSLFAAWPSGKYAVKDENQEKYRDFFPGSEFIGMLIKPEK